MLIMTSSVTISGVSNGFRSTEGNGGWEGRKEGGGMEEGREGQREGWRRAEGGEME